jgi:hypothetical protein
MNLHSGGKPRKGQAERVGRCEKPATEPPVGPDFSGCGRIQSDRSAARAPCWRRKLSIEKEIGPGAAACRAARESDSSHWWAIS